LDITSVILSNISCPTGLFGEDIIESHLILSD